MGTYNQTGFLSPEQRARDIVREVGFTQGIARAQSMQEDMDLLGLSEDLEYWQDVESVLMDMEAHVASGNTDDVYTG
jgi:hypothetical protein